MQAAVASSLRASSLPEGARSAFAAPGQGRASGQARCVGGVGCGRGRLGVGRAWETRGESAAVFFSVSLLCSPSRSAPPHAEKKLGSARRAPRETRHTHTHTLSFSLSHTVKKSQKRTHTHTHTQPTPFPLSPHAGRLRLKRIKKSCSEFRRKKDRTPTLSGHRHPRPRDGRDVRKVLVLEGGLMKAKERARVSE